MEIQAIEAVGFSWNKHQSVCGGCKIKKKVDLLTSIPMEWLGLPCEDVSRGKALGQ